MLADKGYTGAGEHIRTPYKGRNKPASQRTPTGLMPGCADPDERANAQLKSWRILRKLRCCPWRAGKLARAIHVLQDREIGGWKTCLGSRSWISRWLTVLTCGLDACRE